MNNPCPSAGSQVLIPRNSASSTRTSWPPKYTQNLPPFDLMVVDLTDRENIHVRSLDDVCPSRGPLSLRGPGVKGSQPIPHRTSRSRTPSVRTPPPGLWQISDPRPAGTDAPSNSTSNCILRLSPPTSPAVTELPRASRRPNPQRRFSNAAQAPIGSERLRRSSMSDDLLAIGTTRISPGKSILALNSEERDTASTIFLSVLLENRKRQPHAPPMVSMFNPLRAKIPVRTWLFSSTPVPSERFRTPLFPPVPQNHSRRRCNMNHGLSGETKTVFINKKRLNCFTCKTDTLSKRLMLFKYPIEKFDQLKHIERMNRLISPVRDEYAMDVEIQLPHSGELDEDILDSPFLRDLDDFDDGMDDFFDKDGDPILIDDDEDTSMKGLALF